LRLDGGLLRTTAASAGEHFEGLQQAARRCKNKGLIGERLAKKLMRVDVCYNIIRHITGPSVDALLRELEVQLATVSGDVGIPTAMGGEAAEGPAASEPHTKRRKCGDETDEQPGIASAGKCDEEIEVRVIEMHDAGGDVNEEIAASKPVQAEPVAGDLIGVGSSGALARVVRVGFGEYSGEVRTISPNERAGEWTAGCWRSAIRCNVIPAGSVLTVAVCFTAADHNHTVLLPGVQVRFKRFDEDGDILVEHAGCDIPIFWEDVKGLEVG